MYPLVARRARHRCEYCRAPEEATGYRFEVDHIWPRAAGGLQDPANLALSCRTCNAAKAARRAARDPSTGQDVRLFDPRQDRWEDHFRWSLTYRTIFGLTDIGRATVAVLRLNARVHRRARTYWRRLGLIP